MQLLHCEYELINSYNCPVIVFFVCRLFFSFSCATYMANLVFARVYARSRYPKLPGYYLFAFSRLKLRYLFNLNCIRSYAKNGHSYLIMFANFRKLYCLLLFFFSPSFMLSFVPYELVETRTCVCSAPFCNSNKFSFNTSFIFILTAVT